MLKNEAVSTWRALSDNHGKINSVLLSYPGKVRSLNVVLDRYAGIFRQFSGETGFVLLLQAQAQTVVQKYMRDKPDCKELQRITFIYQQLDYQNYAQYYWPKQHFEISNFVSSEWAQDPFLVLQTSVSEGSGAPVNANVLLKPMHFYCSNVGKAGDQFMADFLAAQLDFMVKPFRQQLEGGSACQSKFCTNWY